MNTRRQFLIRAPLSALVVAAVARGEALSADPQAAPVTPGAPPTFGTGVGAGPVVTAATFAEAEKLMQVTMTPAERHQAADSWRESMAPYLERRTGPRRVAIAPPTRRPQSGILYFPASRCRHRVTASSGQPATACRCRPQTMPSLSPP